MSMMLAKTREARVLGISKLGLPIFPIAGADGENDDQNGNGGGNGNGGNGGESGNNGGSNSGNGNGNAGSEGSGQGGNVGEGEALPTYTQAEYQQLEARLRAADKAKGDLQGKLNEIDQASLSETQRVQKALEDANKRIAELEEDLNKGKMSNAILQFPGFTWHDPEMVLMAIDKDMIEIDSETGKVKGIKAALDKLAREKPYLLKGKQGGNEGSGKGGDSGSGSGGNSGGSGASGSNPGNARPDDKNAQRAALTKKYKIHR